MAIKKPSNKLFRTPPLSIVCGPMPPSDGDSLARRAQADFGPLLDALWGLGYYNATLVFDVAGVPLSLGEDPAGLLPLPKLIGPALPFR